MSCLKHFCMYRDRSDVNPLNAKLNPICHLLALLSAHHILHVSRIRVNVTRCCCCCCGGGGVGGGGSSSSSSTYYC